MTWYSLANLKASILVWRAHTAAAPTEKTQALSRLAEQRGRLLLRLAEQEGSLLFRLAGNGGHFRRFSCSVSRTPSSETISGACQGCNCIGGRRNERRCVWGISDHAQITGQPIGPRGGVLPPQARRWWKVSSPESVAKTAAGRPTT